MTDFKLTTQQGEVLQLLIGLIGLTGVHKRPEQGDCMVLDLMPAEHVDGQPFCIRVDPQGRIEFINDEEAGLSERPDLLTSLSLRARHG